MPNSITFSPRERQILALVCVGSDSKQIAYELEIAVATVNTRIVKMFTKAGVSRTELVIWALQHPESLTRDTRCSPGLHTADCECDSPFCASRRKKAA
jgi:DNA-binding CsgD family transcriptional regulator